MSEYQGTFKRYEKKYLVTQQQYNALAKVFAARMVPDRFAESTISNIYYDTPDFRLIRRSLDRPAYKEKLRLRRRSRLSKRRSPACGRPAKS